MELTSKRRQQIAEAVFDRFVRKYLIESEMLEGDKVNLRYLNQLAKELDCNAHALSIAILKSCGRICEMPVTKNLPKEEENKVMLAAAQHHIKQIRVPLKNYKRELGNVATEINLQNPELKLKSKELWEFIYPIYLQILEEIFD